MNEQDPTTPLGSDPAHLTAQESAKWEVGQVVQGVLVSRISQGNDGYFFEYTDPSGIKYRVCNHYDKVRELATSRGKTVEEFERWLFENPVSIQITQMDAGENIGKAELVFDESSSGEVGGVEANAQLQPTSGNSAAEQSPSQETAVRHEVGEELPNVTFTRVEQVNGTIILKSSSRARKIVKVVVPLADYEGEVTPQEYYSSRPFTLKITEDSDPSDPMNGQYLAEIVSTPWNDAEGAQELLSDEEIEERVRHHTFHERNRRAVEFRLYQLTGIVAEERHNLSRDQILERVSLGSRRLVEKLLLKENSYAADAATYLGDFGVPEAVDESRGRLIAAIRKQDELRGRSKELIEEEVAILQGVDGSPIQDELSLLQDIRRERKEVETLEEGLYQESPEAHYGLHLRELKDFKRSLAEGKIVETPYVERQSSEIEAHLRAGQPVMVYGHLGTGKTELSISVAEKMLRNRPDILERIKERAERWNAEHPEVSDDERNTELRAIEKDETSPLVISGYKHASTTEFFGHQNLSIDKVDMGKVKEEIREVEEQFETWKSEFVASHTELSGAELEAELSRGHERILEANLTRMQGGTISTYFLGPIYRAMQEGRTVIIDEVNAIPHEVLISLNHILTRKSGDIVNVQQDSGMKIEVKEGYGIIMTGNINQGDSRYVDRQDLDPAFLSRLHRIEHDYLPQKIEGALSLEAGKGNELYQIMLARVMDKRGNIDVPEGALEELWRLAQAARVTQEVFSGKNKNQSFFFKEGVGRSVSYMLVEGVMSMRGIEKVINQWQKEGYAHELDHYIFNEFVNQPTVTTDKAYLYQLFKERFGFFTGDGWPTNVDYTQMKTNFSITSPARTSKIPVHHDAREVVDCAFGQMEK